MLTRWTRAVPIAQRVAIVHLRYIFKRDIILASLYHQAAATTSAGEFQTAALDALQATEAQSLLFFSSESRLPVLHTPSIPPSSLPAVLSRHIHQARPGRLTPTPARLAPKHLFLRVGDQVARLACPDCARTDFPSVQGLLNHCRLRHARELEATTSASSNVRFSSRQQSAQTLSSVGPSFLVSVFLACVVV